MGKSRQQSISRLLRRTSRLVEPRMTVVLEGRVRMEGPLDEHCGNPDTEDATVCGNCHNTMEGSSQLHCGSCGKPYHNFCLEPPHSIEVDGREEKQHCYRCKAGGSVIKEKDELLKKTGDLVLEVSLPPKQQFHQKRVLSNDASKQPSRLGKSPKIEEQEEHNNEAKKKLKQSLPEEAKVEPPIIQALAMEETNGGGPLDSIGASDDSRLATAVIGEGNSNSDPKVLNEEIVDDKLLVSSSCNESKTLLNNEASVQAPGDVLEVVGSSMEETESNNNLKVSSEVMVDDVKLLVSSNCNESRALLASEDALEVVGIPMEEMESDKDPKVLSEGNVDGKLPASSNCDQSRTVLNNEASGKASEDVLEVVGIPMEETESDNDPKVSSEVNVVDELPASSNCNDNRAVLNTEASGKASEDVLEVVGIPMEDMESDNDPKVSSEANVDDKLPASSDYDESRAVLNNEASGKASEDAVEVGGVTMEERKEALLLNLSSAHQVDLPYEEVNYSHMKLGDGNVLPETDILLKKLALCANSEDAMAQDHDKVESNELGIQSVIPEEVIKLDSGIHGEAAGFSQPSDTMASSMSIDCDIKVCDICGDPGYEDMLAICSECNEGAEHTYCMQVFPDGALEHWVCEGCKVKRKAMGWKQSETPLRSLSLTRNVLLVNTKKLSFGTTRLRLSARLDKRKLGPRLKAFPLRHPSDSNSTSTSSGVIRRPANEISIKKSADGMLTGPPLKRQAVENDPGGILARPMLSGPANEISIKKSTYGMLSGPPLKRQAVENDPGGILARPMLLSREASMKNPDSGKVKFIPLADINATTGQQYNRGSSKPPALTISSSNPLSPKLCRNRIGSPTSLCSSLSKLPAKRMASGGGEALPSFLLHSKTGSPVRAVSTPKTCRESQNPPRQGLNLMKDGVENVSGIPLPVNFPHSQSMELASSSSNSPKAAGENTSGVIKSFSESTTNLVVSPLSGFSTGIKESSKTLRQQHMHDLVSKAQFPSAEDKVQTWQQVSGKNPKEGGKIIMAAKNADSQSMRHLSDKPANTKEYEVTDRPKGRPHIRVVGSSTICYKCKGYGHSAQSCVLESARASFKQPEPSINELTPKPEIDNAIPFMMEGRLGFPIAGIGVDSGEIVASPPVLAHDRVGANVVAIERSRENTDFSTPPFCEGALNFNGLAESWRGSFHIKAEGSRVKIYDGIQAYTSNQAVPKFHYVIKKLQSKLQLEELPRSSQYNSWPTQFQSSPPNDANITLYFFPRDKESYEWSYKPLVDHMVKHDLALMGHVEDKELLVFPSNHLSKKSESRNPFAFLWAALCDKKLCTLDSGHAIAGSKDHVKPIEQVPTPITLEHNRCEEGRKHRSNMSAKAGRKTIKDFTNMQVLASLPVPLVSSSQRQFEQPVPTSLQESSDHSTPLRINNPEESSACAMKVDKSLNLPESSLKEEVAMESPPQRIHPPPYQPSPLLRVSSSERLGGNRNLTCSDLQSSRERERISSKPVERARDRDNRLNIAREKCRERDDKSREQERETEHDKVKDMERERGRVRDCKTERRERERESKRCKRYPPPSSARCDWNQDNRQLSHHSTSNSNPNSLNSQGSQYSCSPLKNGYNKDNTKKISSGSEVSQERSMEPPTEPCASSRKHKNNPRLPKERESSSLTAIADLNKNPSEVELEEDSLSVSTTADHTMSYHVFIPTGTPESSRFDPSKSSLSTHPFLDRQDLCYSTCDIPESSPEIAPNLDLVLGVKETEPHKTRLPPLVTRLVETSLPHHQSPHRVLIGKGKSVDISDGYGLDLSLTFPQPTIVDTQAIVGNTYRGGKSVDTSLSLSSQLL